MNQPRFEIRKLKSRPMWYWVLLDTDGKIVAMSEKKHSYENAEEGVAKATRLLLKLLAAATTDAMIVVMNPKEQRT